MQELSREPSPTEIAESLKITEKIVKNSFLLKDKHLSLDAQIGEEDKKNLMQSLKSNDKTPESVMMDKFARAEIIEALSQLTTREEKIIRTYFGIGVEQTKTLEEIGKELRLTRERVRQIKDKAIRRLRTVLGREKMRSLLDN